MSFIGNIAAARAKAIGKYNESVAYQEAAYAEKAAVQEKVYNTIERPRFVDQQIKHSQIFLLML